MKIKINSKQIDLNFYPFRGILSEIARERGTSRQAVQQAARKGRVEILAMIVEKVKERRAKVAKLAVQVVKKKEVKEPMSYKDKGVHPGYVNPYQYGLGASPHPHETT